MKFFDNYTTLASLTNNYSPGNALFTDRKPRNEVKSHKKGLEIMIWLMMLRKKNGKNTNVFLKNFIAKYGIMLTMEYGCGMSIVSIKSDSCEKDRQKN